ncbi:hypothetical protein [Calothrix sp. NIES-3974]|uniref:hypothetical protein n=1 Tax=Calothrix sp. NIES-3974 TaxID=2005462 RepID=UPI000B5F3AC2|nr:hypothetical protein [Calothrix sp. NIES-3974]BAZ04114.1 hypothetical protein NIES3974_07440 [Calothrix sp. NIES-3974]
MSKVITPFTKRKASGLSLLYLGLQRSYRHQRMAFRLYQALAQREVLPDKQKLWLILARNAEKSAATYAIRLLCLDAKLPQDLNHWSDRICYWLLLKCKPEWVITWVEWQQHKDARLFLQLWKQLLQQPSIWISHE